VAAPLRAVVRSQVGPRSTEVKLIDGRRYVLCGPPPRIDTLSCGHDVLIFGPARKRRRCKDCAVKTGQDPLVVADRLLRAAVTARADEAR